MIKKKIRKKNLKAEFELVHATFFTRSDYVAVIQLHNIEKNQCHITFK